MAIVYKLDVLQALKKAGYNTNKIRNEKILSESTLQKLRRQEAISFANLDRLCSMLKCRPGDLIDYVPDEGTGDQ